MSIHELTFYLLTVAGALVPISIRLMYKEEGTMSSLNWSIFLFRCAVYVLSIYEGTQHPAQFDAVLQLLMERYTPLIAIPALLNFYTLPEVWFRLELWLCSPQST